MPELRRDPVAGRWVIIASERAKRPDDFSAEAPPATRNLPCAFCAGNESMTPQEIMAVRSGSSWKSRVVANKFPALMVEGDLAKRGDGMYDLMNGVGAHEVIIESPRHEVSITKLGDDEVRDVLWLYKQRLLDLRNDYRLVYGLVFKNVRDKAGASMEHTHSQLIATPIVPLQVEQEIRRCAEYYDYRGRCLLCDMVMQEINALGDTLQRQRTEAVEFNFELTHPSGAIHFAKQPPLGGVGGNPLIYVRFESGAEHSDEIYLGRCVQLSK